jgi:5'-methylthioadenosine phosphorylase
MMSEKQFGFIGGSGVYKMEGVEIISEHVIETPFGKPSSAILEARFEGHQCYFLARHGEGHTKLPSDVNYRANIFALKTLGVDYLVSISAVGSLKEELPPETFFMPDQFIDWTKGKRERSFFSDSLVGHVSVANPINKQLQNIIYQACQKAGVSAQKDGSYICIEGPQFSTRAESAMYRSFGASVIGMTNVPEAFLAKEAGMAYATMAMVTDFDAWKEEHCTLEEIMKVIKVNTTNAQKVMKELIPTLASNRFVFEKENVGVVMTATEKIPADKKEIYEILCR